MYVHTALPQIIPWSLFLSSDFSPWPLNKTGVLVEDLRAL